MFSYSDIQTDTTASTVLHRLLTDN